jgi:hypothetical protein
MPRPRRINQRHPPEAGLPAHLLLFRASTPIVENLARPDASHLPGSSSMSACCRSPVQARSGPRPRDAGCRTAAAVVHRGLGGPARPPRPQPAAIWRRPGANSDGPATNRPLNRKGHLTSYTSGTARKSAGTVPQTAVIPFVTRHYTSGLLNFATHSPEDSQAKATENTVLRASSRPDRRDRSSTERRVSARLSGPLQGADRTVAPSSRPRRMHIYTLPCLRWISASATLRAWASGWTGPTSWPS